MTQQTKKACSMDRFIDVGFLEASHTYTFSKEYTQDYVWKQNSCKNWDQSKMVFWRRSGEANKKKTYSSRLDSGSTSFEGCFAKAYHPYLNINSMKLCYRLLLFLPENMFVQHYIFFVQHYMVTPSLNMFVNHSFSGWMTTKNVLDVQAFIWLCMGMNLWLIYVRWLPWILIRASMLHKHLSSTLVLLNKPKTFLGFRQWQSYP